MAEPAVPVALTSSNRTNPISPHLHRALPGKNHRNSSRAIRVGCENLRNLRSPSTVMAGSGE
ncbi:MAG: hypothetical protein L0219_05690, partial [Phycisphaerales bacterium]|nr:hypothetical protein [Phycisphaerales bacterium]